MGKTSKKNSHKKRIKKSKRHNKHNKSGKKTRKLKKLQCGPEGNGKKYTCIRDQSICKLKTLWNKRHPDNKIKNGNIHSTWKQLRSKLKNVCNKESCWLRQKFAKGGLGNEMSVAFAPESPEKWKKNPNG